MGYAVTVNTQQISSILRQILAYVSIAFGILTQAVSGIHLPVAMSTVLTVIGGVLINVEHYVSDPSTGTPASPVAAAPVAVVSAPKAVAAMPPVVEVSQ